MYLRLLLERIELKETSWGAGHTLNVGRTNQWTGDHMDTKWKKRKLGSMHNSVPPKQECPWASLQLLSFKQTHTVAWGSLSFGWGCYWFPLCWSFWFLDHESMAIWFILESINMMHYIYWLVYIVSLAWNSLGHRNDLFDMSVNSVKYFIKNFHIHVPQRNWPTVCLLVYFCCCFGPYLICNQDNTDCLVALLLFLFYGTAWGSLVLVFL